MQARKPSFPAGSCRSRGASVFIEVNGYSSALGAEGRVFESRRPDQPIRWLVCEARSIGSASCAAGPRSRPRHAPPGDQRGCGRLLSPDPLTGRATASGRSRARAATARHPGCRAPGDPTRLALHAREPGARKRRRPEPCRRLRSTGWAVLRQSRLPTGPRCCNLRPRVRQPGDPGRPRAARPRDPVWRRGAGDHGALRAWGSWGWASSATSARP